MSDTSQGPGWWLASDGKWYPPELWTGPPAVQGQAPAYGNAWTVTPGQPGGGGPPAYPGAPGPYGGAGAYPPYGYGQQMPYGAPGDQEDERPRDRIAGVLAAPASCSSVCPASWASSSDSWPRSQIRRSNGTQGGEGLALAGIIVGFAWIVILALIIAVAATNSSNSGVIVHGPHGAVRVFG